MLCCQRRLRTAVFMVQLCDELLATSLKLAVLLCIGDVATPQLVAMESTIPFMITHSPSHMFVTNRLDEELAFI